VCWCMSLCCRRDRRRGGRRSKGCKSCISYSYISFSSLFAFSALLVCSSPPILILYLAPSIMNRPFLRPFLLYCPRFLSSRSLPLTLLTHPRDLDMIMLADHNSCEPTAADWEKLFVAADPRFKLLGVQQPELSTMAAVEVEWAGSQSSEQTTSR